ncbi:MAG: S-methyl-5-thioribose-1-phosphate isomerase [Verrucomicrobiales bacterium]|nr:S-methyl-5-thioribose-1-phosphate isomerase [Verrucomicrobiales bacterium]
MLVDGKPYRTVWLESAARSVGIIDQRKLPFSFETVELTSTEETASAILEMYVRGAGCIGAVAAHGMYLASEECREKGLSSVDFDECFRKKGNELCATRPTAVNLEWAVNRQIEAVREKDSADEKVQIARDLARIISDEDATWCKQIGEHGLDLIRSLLSNKESGDPVNILTHCNAGWLAFVDHGSATSPIYAAHDAGIPVHVWVDETRPRNQGARLTAWELGKHGVPHTVIPDNTGGHLMQHGMVDLVITGTDRTTHTGDVANKIGTYLKALAAKDNGIPFYVALPSSTIDWETRDGVAGVPIEKRGSEEVAMVSGVTDEKIYEETDVWIVSPGSPVANYAFDVTPSRLVTGLITERGICEASESAIHALFPEK